jgi:hypothetical protein
MKSNRIISLVLILALFNFVNYIFAIVHSAERRVLVSLYEATSGENWFDNDNWLEGDPCENHWYGIQCGQDQGGNPTVVRMFVKNSFWVFFIIDSSRLLSDNKLTGQLPSFIDQRSTQRRGNAKVKAVQKIGERVSNEVIQDHIIPRIRELPIPAFKNLFDM